ncbi:hypothetical protein [Paenibacillus sp. A14]|uniref:hypothetical protein n=1 Tax=Paenibacillus sp. A14 TaxID=3119820 RepID=UPI002FE213B9
MYLLNVEEYDKVLEPLRQVPFNTLFAQSVVLRKIKGAIYVDHLSSPSAFYIIHPYGMSLLCGSTDHLPFLQALKNYLIDSEHIRRHPEWLQVFPDGWNRFIRNLINSEASAQQEGSGSGFDSGFGNLSDRDGFRPIRENTRVNFTFDRKAFEATGPTSPKRFDIVPTSAAIFRDVKRHGQPEALLERRGTLPLRRNRLQPHAE